VRGGSWFSGEPLQIVTSARTDAERRGVALADVLLCKALGPDGNELAGCATPAFEAGIVRSPPRDGRRR